MSMRQVRKLTSTKTIITDYETFMKKRGWNQTQAAQAIGCSQEHLSRIFRGLKNPSIKLIDKMEEVMGGTK